MKIFSIIEEPSPESIKISLEKYGASLEDFKGMSHPQEDYLALSKKSPIFVVADGVTLIQYILDKDKKPYPNPSPAGDVARIFCQSFIENAEAKYESFKPSDTGVLFKSANDAVGNYNAEHGRTKKTVDYWDTDFYAATAAFAVYKDSVVYWGSVCDSYVTHLSSKGEVLFRSPECQKMTQAESPKFTGDKADHKVRAQFAWSMRRNKLNEKGERVGYGVVTGESEALNYLSFGSFSLKEGETAVIYTDGFEPYLLLPEFIQLLVAWPENLGEQVKAFTARKTQEDPDTYGHERSLMVFQG